MSHLPIPVTARSKAWVCGHSLTGVAGSNTAGGMDVCRKCRVLSGRVLCVGLITRLEECGVSECDREASIMRKSLPNRVCCSMGIKGCI
jgi:hypothetical protein